MAEFIEMITPKGATWKIPLENVDKALERDAQFSNPEDEQLYQSYVQSGAKKRSEPNTSPTTWLDRGKEFAQGAAHNVGETLDTVNKYVSAVPPMLVSKLAGRLGEGISGTNPEAGEAISKFGQGAQNIADHFHNSNLADDYANADILKTDNNPDKTSEIFKAGGEFLGEGVKFATGAKILDNANKTINAVQIVTRQGKTVAMPWLNKLNSLLSSQGENIARTSAQFAAGGMGAEMGKQIQDRDNRPQADGVWEELKNATADTMVDMAGFVVGGLVIDGAEKALLKSTKEAGKTIVNFVDYAKNPSEEAWSKVKNEFPDAVKSPIKSSFTKMYEKLVNNADNAIDEEALVAMKKAGITPSALSIYKDNERVFTIANLLPSRLYRAYADNLEKETLSSIERDLDKRLGIIDPMRWQAEESMIRNASESLDKVIEKPDLPQIYKDSTNKIEGVLDKELGELPSSSNSSSSSSSSSQSSIQSARDASVDEIERMKSFYNERKNHLYTMAIEGLKDSDYVPLNKIHTAAKKLFKEFNVPGAKGTSLGKVRDVAKDVKKGTANKNDDVMYAFDAEEMDALLNAPKAHPSVLLKMSQGINEQIAEGIIKGKENIKSLTSLTTAINESILDATRKGEISNKFFAQFKTAADSYYADVYKPFIELDATKAISSGKSPSYIWQQMQTIDGRHRVYETLAGLPKGEAIYNVLQRAKSQEYIMNYISDGTDLNPKKITDLFSNISHEYELSDLMGYDVYSKLKKVSPKISSNIAEAQKLLQNPLIADNSVNNIIKLINTREGIELIREQVIKLPEKEAKDVMNAVNRVAAKFNIENEITKDTKLNNDRLITMLSDLKEEDYLVGILGKKGLEKFKKDILPLSRKIGRIHNQDVDAGGYIATRGANSIGGVLKRVISEVGTGASGYGAGGVKGAIAAVLGKNWFAYSFAKASTDPKLVNRLIELGRRGNAQQTGNFITRIAKKIAKETVVAANKQAFKLHEASEAVNKGKEMLPDTSTEEGRQKMRDDARRWQKNSVY
jgi:hypothetical protein